jgi:hypothetical protein
MEDFIRREGHHLGNEKDADDMKIAINTLDRLIEDDYLDNSLKFHKEKWGNVDIKFIPNDDEGNSIAEFVYDKAKTEKDKEQARKEFKIAADHSEYMVAQDLDFLFEVLKKKIRHWWD